MQKPIILCFEMNKDSLIPVAEAAKRFGAVIKRVNVGEYSLPLAAIAGNIEPKTVYPGMPLPEPFMVFVNFPEALLEVFLDTLKNSGAARGVIKAVLTQHNAAWTPIELFTELYKEREAFRQAKNK